MLTMIYRIPLVSGFSARSRARDNPFAEHMSYSVRGRHCLHFTTGNAATVREMVCCRRRCRGLRPFSHPVREVNGVESTRNR